MSGRPAVIPIGLAHLEGRTAVALRTLRTVALDGSRQLGDSATQVRDSYQAERHNQHDRGSKEWWGAFSAATYSLVVEAGGFSKAIQLVTSAVMKVELGDRVQKLEDPAFQRIDPLYNGLVEFLQSAKDLETSVFDLHGAVLRQDPRAMERAGAVAEQISNFFSDVYTSNFLEKFPPGVSPEGVTWDSSLSRSALAERANARLAAAHAPDLPGM